MKSRKPPHHLRQNRLSEQDILARAERIPQLSIPDHLPVARFAEELKAAIEAHPVVIVAGETGSGKTTQLPKLALAAGCGRRGWIGHTQPRRLAARMVAARIAEELGSPLGGANALVGSKIRFADHSHPDHLIKVMTDGILLMELVKDRRLHQYDTIIIDEAHERSLNIDFLLGYLKQLRLQRPELKLIITSATLDSERFSQFFEDAPVLEIPGKTYPVEFRYSPCYEEDIDVAEGILRAVETLDREGPGDILVFLPGEREIRETMRYLEGRLPRRTVLPLYSRLNNAAQQRIFHPQSGEQRIVLATNVAETSLTVPGIRYVIDTGLARIARYLPRQKVERLQVEPIDQSSARQRAGRCGRTMPGICVRLYSQDDLLNRQEYPDPEVLRTSLAGVVLKMAALHLGDVEKFPWLNPPSGRAIVEAQQTLQELGALDEHLECTSLGKALAKLPIEPRLGAMLLAAHDRHVLTEALIILSGHTTGDPRERPLEKAQAADQAQKVFIDERSDFLGWLKLWDAIESHTEGKTRRQQQDWFDRHFINGRRVHEWQAFFDQLAEQLDTLGWVLNSRHEVLDNAALHQSLLIGLLDWVGQWQAEQQCYMGPRGQRFQIHPSSALKKRKPQWIFAGEQVETTQRYAREVAECDPVWIERMATHRLSRQYLEPHWEHKSQQPVAFERLSFGQLVLFARRKIRYAPIDPAGAREVLLRDALAGGRLESDLPFWNHHRSQLQRLEEWQIRDRSQRALLDDERLYKWYAERIPEDITDLRRLKAWYEHLSLSEQRALEWPLEAVVWQSDEVEWKQFPDEWNLDGIMFRLRYCHDPKRDDDGVTLEVPLAYLNRLEEATLSWSVPGLWREIIAERIKALPKLYRQRFLPPDAWVTRFLESVEPYKDVLDGALWHFLRSQIKEWQTESRLPWEKTRSLHLVLGIRVLDESGNSLGYFRDLGVAKAAFAHQAGQAFQNTMQDALETENTPTWEWSVGDLPQHIQWGGGDDSMTVFPALQPKDEHGVALQYFETAELAQSAHYRGVLHLLQHQLKKELEQQIPLLKNASALMLPFRAIANIDQWQSAFTHVVLQRSAWGENEPLPWKSAEFDTLRQRTRTRLPAVAQAALQHLQTVGQHYAKLNQAIHQLPQGHPLKSSVTQRRDRLLPADWMSLVPWSVWTHLPRYLEALYRRVQRFPDQRDRDARNHQNWENWWNRWQGNCQRWQRSGEPVPEALADFRWKLEELAVSLWAQELKTPYPISFKRLEKAWEELS